MQYVVEEKCNKCRKFNQRTLDHIETRELLALCPGRIDYPNHVETLILTSNKTTPDCKHCKDNK